MAATWAVPGLFKNAFLAKILKESCNLLQDNASSLDLLKEPLLKLHSFQEPC